MGSQDIISQLPPEEAAQVDIWTQNAWADCVARNPRLAASTSYEQGFRDGYVNRLTANSKRQWQAGYRHGTRLALQHRLRGMPTAMALEPTPLHCSSPVAEDGVHPFGQGPSTQGHDDLHEPSTAIPDAASDTMSPGRSPTSIEPTELQPESIYTLDGDEGIIEAPTAIETESETKPNTKIEQQPTPSRTRGLPPADTSRPPVDDSPSPSNVPNPLDLSVPPEADSKTTDSKPRQEQRQPAPDNTRIDDDLDLLSPFSNAVPPNGEDQGGTRQNGASSGPSASDLEEPDEGTNGRADDVKGFDLQIHDEFEGDTSERNEEARAWLREGESATGRPADSFYDRSVRRSSVRRTNHTETDEDERPGVPEESSESSFFATAITSPVTRAGKGNSAIPTTIPVKKQVWYFDRHEDESDAR